MGPASEAGAFIKDQLHAKAVEESGGQVYPIVAEFFLVNGPNVPGWISSLYNFDLAQLVSSFFFL